MITSLLVDSLFPLQCIHCLLCCRPLPSHSHRQSSIDLSAKHSPSFVCKRTFFIFYATVEPKCAHQNGKPTEDVTCDPELIAEHKLAFVQSWQVSGGRNCNNPCVVEMREGMRSVISRHLYWNITTKTQLLVRFRTDYPQLLNWVLTATETLHYWFNRINSVVWGHPYTKK